MKFVIYCINLNYIIVRDYVRRNLAQSESHLQFHTGFATDDSRSWQHGDKVRCVCVVLRSKRAQLSSVFCEWRCPSPGGFHVTAFCSRLLVSSINNGAAPTTSLIIFFSMAASNSSSRTGAFWPWLCEIDGDTTHTWYMISGWICQRQLYVHTYELLQQVKAECAGILFGICTTTYRNSAERT